MTEIKRKTIGLALGSGGWRGLAHFGVIKEFERQGIPIDCISGSSAGALIGGLYSYYGSTYEIESIISSFGYRSLYGILFDPARKLGLINGDKYTKFIEKYTGDVRIEDLKIKFTAVCSDLIKGDPVGLTEGKLSSAIRASSSMPTVFKPMMINGRLLVDGGNTMPVPVKMVKEMGADIVVAVNLYGKMFPYKREYLKKQELSLISVTRITYQMLIESLASENTKEADIVINPKIWEGEFNIFKNLINNQETTIEDGERAARDVIPAIKKLLY
ncbi:MAG: hypothetical protein UU51_C0004G0004 [Microgenomates group bacterium GW2011_GWC1_41_20]|uniref:PNPLA domain-containing protein n=3 Tax=Candidatus Woeseibacteriota TaxID=1752722 RepID=A0A0G0QR11_9BACT|nr:MAG: hypothetical protein UT76_C0020G0004 [Candidatus Woesebacteria bacterium GW2011_GWB1_40_12]KKR90843.1 MAG: hypothetical protein UU39_C0007G0019 [Candidatus Woesebacteria bacterium GW2011_GWD1_41_12]KKS00609.1 MAG: hypothetical protein UU51_C0004G0004 [Microgenomates group bacterium GW2011_GWC1_41_20]KKS04800.1 MAG: hypothetical protein UU57_C0017G0005 [Candidatus Woesebacteria bacterium GW2011_GWE1_41_24]